MLGMSTLLGVYSVARIVVIVLVSFCNRISGNSFNTSEVNPHHLNHHPHESLYELSSCTTHQIDPIHTMGTGHFLLISQEVVKMFEELRKYNL